MRLFTAGMKMQHRMILDVSIGGSIKIKTHEENKDLVEQMCQNEYNMSHDRNDKTAGIIKVDKEVAYKVEIELLRRQLAEKETKEASVKQAE
jgi:alpha-D-ribose 1-methylphosphonate 5-triphosphate synthase subunit PhnI